MRPALRDERRTAHVGAMAFILLAGGVCPYGSQTCLFLPDVERQNNPALGG